MQGQPKLTMEQVAEQGAACLLTGDFDGWDVLVMVAEGMGYDPAGFLQCVVDHTFQEGYNFRVEEERQAA